MEFKSRNFVLKCRLEILIKILYRGFAIEFQSKFHSEIFTTGDSDQKSHSGILLATCRFSKRAMKDTALVV